MKLSYSDWRKAILEDMAELQAPKPPPAGYMPIEDWCKILQLQPAAARKRLRTSRKIERITWPILDSMGRRRVVPFYRFKA